MLNEIVDILIQYTDYDAERITEETTLIDDLELNSFDLLTLVSDFEEKYGATIPDEDIVNFKTVGDILRYLEARQ